MSIIEIFGKFLHDSQIDHEIKGNLISFKWENLQYVMIYSQDDSVYFRLMLPRVVDVNDQNKATLEAIALELSTKYKVGKIITFNQSLWLSFEAFISSDVDNSKFFARAMRILKLMYEDIRNLLKE